MKLPQVYGFLPKLMKLLTYPKPAEYLTEIYTVALALRSSSQAATYPPVYHT